MTEGSSVDLSWKKMISVWVLFFGILLLIVSFALIAVNVATLSSLRGDAAWINVSGRRRMQTQLLLRLARKIVDAQGSERTRLATKIRQSLETMEDRLRDLSEGSVALGLPKPKQAAVVGALNEVQRAWTSRIKPNLLKTINAPSGDASRQWLERLDEMGTAFMAQLNRTVGLYEQSSAETLRLIETMQYIFAAIGLFVLSLIGVSTRKLVSRERAAARDQD